MQYLGGKEKIARKIADFLESKRKKGQVFVDLCCGGLSITARMKGKRVANDFHPHLISLYRHIQKRGVDWLPQQVDREFFNHMKKHKRDNKPNPLLAFIGFGCAFSGSYFTGYAGDKRNFAAMAKNSLTNKFRGIDQNVMFTNTDLFQAELTKKLIYIDPPYKGTSKYLYNPKFDHDRFWNKARELSKKNDVYISEYSAPSDFEIVYQIPRKIVMNPKMGLMRMENIYRMKKK